jgi:hypothetical protein
VFKWLAAGAAVMVTVPLALLLLVSAAATSSTTTADLAGGPSALALSDIPPPTWCCTWVARPATHPRYPARVAAARPLIIARRPTAWSARAATTAVAAVTSAGSRVTVLAIVSDGRPEPPAATARFRLLQPHVQAVIGVPFVPGLRLADDPAGVALPRRALRSLDDIRAAVGRPRLIR